MGNSWVHVSRDVKLDLKEGVFKIEIRQIAQHQQSLPLNLDELQQSTLLSH